DHFSSQGKYYRVDDLVLQPKPLASRSRPRPVIYAGGESETAKNLISQKCDAYVMHGDPPEKIREKIQDMSARRKKWGLPRMQFGIAAYAIVRETEKEAQDELRRITDVKQNAAGYQNYQQWLANTQLEQRVSLEDYSVSNRGQRRRDGALLRPLTNRLDLFRAGRGQRNCRLKGLQQVFGRQSLLAGKGSIHAGLHCGVNLSAGVTPGRKGQPIQIKR